MRLMSLIFTLLLPIAIVAVSGAAASGGAPCIPWTVGETDGNYIIPGSMGRVVYRRIGQISLEADAYLQPDREVRPAVIVIHGGGGVSGNRVSFVGQFLELLTKSGYHWFTIDYRLGGAAGASDSASDLQTAVEFIRCHARRLRVDPERIILLGEDTGAAMAAMVASDPANRIQAQILIGGSYPLPPGTAIGGMPATLIIHGSEDQEVRPEIAEGLCREVGSRCQYLAVKGASHRAENWWPSQWSYKPRLVEWLDRQSGMVRSGDRSLRQRRTRLQKEIVYDSRYGLKLDAWRPAGRGPFPAVVLVHGGGWEAGDKVTYLTPLLRPLSKAGFALEDLRSAIRFVHRNARRFRIDPRRIAILGESAGGQMVSLVATERMPEVAAVVSFYGVYDLLPMAARLGPRSIPTRLLGVTTLDEEGRQRLISYSPLHKVDPGMAPMLLVCGTADGLFPQHEAMTERLRNKRGNSS
ncbi:MAG: alpha/beta hydrolase [Acidobacteria bacterium]|nr:alpha/beta hydrolase [Acidobacteriota bacterium]